MADKTLKQYGKTKLLPKTGQTTSYESGDDGDYEAGNPVSPRLVDNGNGTVSDRATGLMWVKSVPLIIPGASVIASNQIQRARGGWATDTSYLKGDLISTDVATPPNYVCIVDHTSSVLATDITAGKWILTIWAVNTDEFDVSEVFTWEDALTACNNLVYAGFSDWRLPNATELLSILDYSTSGFYSIFGTNLGQSLFITSTSYKINEDTQAMAIHGVTGYMTNELKANASYIIPVRGGI